MSPVHIVWLAQLGEPVCKGMRQGPQIACADSTLGLAASYGLCCACSCCLLQSALREQPEARRRASAWKRNFPAIIRDCSSICRTNVEVFRLCGHCGRRRGKRNRRDGPFHRLVPSGLPGGNAARAGGKGPADGSAGDDGRRTRQPPPRASQARGRRGSGSIAAAVDKRQGGAAPGYEGKSAVSTGPDTDLRGHARKGRHALASDTAAGQSHWNFRGPADRRETAAEPRISGRKPPPRLSLSAFRKWTSPFRPRPRRVQPRPVPCRRVPGTDARPIADLPRLCPAPGGASFPPPDARKVCGNCLGPGDSPRKKGGTPCQAAEKLSRTGATGFRKARRRRDRPACASPFFGETVVQLQTGMPNRVFQQPDTLPLRGPRNATTFPTLRGRGHNAGPALRRGHGRQPPGRSWCARGSLSASLEPQRHSRVALIPGAEPDVLAKRILAARAAAWKPPEIPLRANLPP